MKKMCFTWNVENIFIVTSPSFIQQSTRCTHHIKLCLSSTFTFFYFHFHFSYLTFTFYFHFLLFRSPPEILITVNCILLHFHSEPNFLSNLKFSVVQVLVTIIYNLQFCGENIGTDKPVLGVVSRSMSFCQGNLWARFVFKFLFHNQSLLIFSCDHHMVTVAKSDFASGNRFFEAEFS